MYLIHIRPAKIKTAQRPQQKLDSNNQSQVAMNPTGCQVEIFFHEPIKKVPIKTGIRDLQQKGMAA
jgi:hypothetical protein